MEEFNLIEILKDAPIGTRLYSPICGECELKEVSENVIYVKGEQFIETFYSNGTYYKDYGECLLFPSKDNRDWSTFKVESKAFQVGDHIRNKNTESFFFLTQKSQSGEGFWARRIIFQDDDNEVFIDKHYFSDYEKVEKFNPEWLKPFDRMMGRRTEQSIWRVNLFSHLDYNDNYPYIMCDGGAYKTSIPYNEETKHLVGTADEEPEFYKID